MLKRTHISVVVNGAIAALGQNETRKGLIESEALECTRRMHALDSKSGIQNIDAAEPLTVSV